jgi:hypothetical protein
MTDILKLSFAERIKLKQNSGYAEKVKDKIPELREKAIDMKSKQ